MKKSLLYALVVLVLSAFAASGLCVAVEKPAGAGDQPKKVEAKEGKKEVEQPATAVTADDVKKAIKAHVKAQSKATRGVFIIRDDKLNKDWRLKLAKIHDPVRTFEKEGKTVYFTCCDFKSLDSTDVLDIDFWLVQKGNRLEVIDTKIHKLNGEPRYTYEGTAIKEIK